MRPLVVARGVYAGKGRERAVEVAKVRWPKHEEKLGLVAIATLVIGRASVYRALAAKPEDAA